MKVVIVGGVAGGASAAARHTTYDHNLHLAPSTIAAISDLGR